VLWSIVPEASLAAPVGIVPLGWTCGEAEQSINVGYSDYYGPLLPNQWVDVTGVPSGRYRLDIVVDPENRLQESDETNNRLSVLIDLVNPTLPESTGAPLPDLGEGR